MEKILIATGNAHKVSEFSSILRNLGADVELVSPKDLGDDSEPVENGDSYAENSRIKASYYYEKYHMPTIADDSGIESD
ncbi:MAG: non-canonical purine NTP pyrophosphatase, partial [Erysipelotrichaceae bacterium]|nr:non-canonical purine NTP pyrophosphatase [Erysipelotrichaceae bacterium]